MSFSSPACRHRSNPEADGYFSGLVSATIGDRYRFRLDGSRAPVSGSRIALPATRPLTDHPEIVDPSAYRAGATRPGAVSCCADQVLLRTACRHVHGGRNVDRRDRRTDSARRRSASRCLEIMPVAEFDGRFGWGYDGVDLFAPSHLYGTPDDFRRFVDAAHAHGLGVILDVVYEPLRAVGQLPARVFARPTSPTSYDNEWGDAINFDGAGSRAGARVLRDQRRATGSTSSISTGCASTRRSRSSTHPTSTFWRSWVATRGPRRGRPRPSCSSPRTSRRTRRLVRPIADGGYGLDALWNDDLHHSAMVALTGRAEAYYSDYPRRAAGIRLGGQIRVPVSGAALSLAGQAARHAVAGTCRQPASSRSCRTTIRWRTPPGGSEGTQLTSPGRWRAMTALLLLGPGTPLLVPGPGVRGVGAVPLFCRLRRATQRGGPRRAADVSVAVHAACRTSPTAGF